MPFTYSSGKITQANEASKAITSIAPLSTGITVTCAAHGYSNGDFIQIKGTTDYNYAYLISGVTTNTFDISNEKIRGDIIAFTSSQTGTCERGDVSIAGMIGLTGVTTTVNAGLTKVHNGTNGLNITGCLMMDGRGYQLISNKPDDGLQVTGYGHLRLGKVLYAQSEYHYVHPTIPYINTSQTALFYTPGTSDTTHYGCFTVDGPNTQVHWEFCTIQALTFGAGADVGNGFQFINNANIYIRRGVFSTRSRLSGMRTPNIIIDDKFTYIGSTIIFSQHVAGNEPENLEMIATDSAVFGQKAAEFNWRNLDIANKGNTADLKVFTESSVTLTNQNAINNSTGNNIKIKSDTPSTDSRNKARNAIIKEIVVHTSKTDGTSIEGAKVYTRDTDNGQRKNLNGIDDTADKEYTGTTDVNGDSSTMAITTCIVNVASSTSTPPGTDVNGGTDNSGAYRKDFRGKADTTLPGKEDDATQAAYDDTARFDLLVISYGSLITVQEVLLTGIGVLSVNAIMLTDIGVTLSKASAGLLTGISINPTTKQVTVSENHDVSEIYDYIKWYENENPDVVWDNGRSTIISALDGNNFSFASDWDLIINTGITVTATGKKINFSGTGTWTLTGTAAFNGLMEDATNARVPINITNIVTGTRLYITKDSDSSVITNEVVSGTTYVLYYIEASDTAITVRLRKGSAAPFYKEYQSAGTVTKAAGLTIAVSQELDA